MRPYFTYNAFYPAERAYTHMFEVLKKGDVLVASPLLTFASPLVRLHCGMQLGIVDCAGRQVAKRLKHLKILAMQRRAITHVQQLQDANHLFADPQRQ